MPESPNQPARSDGGAPDVLHIARLARLSIDPARKDELAAQFTRILHAFETLARLDVTGVEPMTRPTDSTDVLRDDRSAPSLSADMALANAPARVEDFYAVPKTIGGEL